MQVAFMLGRHQVFLELPEEMDDYEDFTEILSNSHLNTHFLSLGREVGACLMPFSRTSVSFLHCWTKLSSVASLRLLSHSCTVGPNCQALRCLQCSLSFPLLCHTAPTPVSFMCYLYLRNEGTSSDLKVLRNMYWSPGFVVWVLISRSYYGPVYIYFLLPFLSLSHVGFTPKSLRVLTSLASQWFANSPDLKVLQSCFSVFCHLASELCLVCGGGGG